MYRGSSHAPKLRIQRTVVRCLEDRKGATGASAFEDLAVFKRAYRISLDVHRASLKFPAVEQRALADQVRRASKSICANVAEGFARQGPAPADFRRFVMMALGSSDEMRVWSRYCLDLGCIDEPTWRIWRDEYQEISKMLQGLARSLKHRIRSLTSDICPLNGSGAFRKPVKVAREGCWRYRK